MIIGIILIIVAIIIETILIGHIMVILRLIDNEQAFDEEFWNESNKNNE